MHCKQIKPFFNWLKLQRSLRCSNSSCKIWAACIFCAGFHSVVSWDLLQFRDFVRFMLAVCIILLRNHKCPVAWRPLAMSCTGGSVFIQLAVRVRGLRASNKIRIHNMLPTNRRQWLCDRCWPMGVFDVTLLGGGRDYKYVKKLLLKPGVYNWRYGCSICFCTPISNILLFI
jgi:hypothetical protein